jgi:dihydroorotate dehydrogenase
MLDPEQAHELTLKSLEAGIYPRDNEQPDPRLAVDLWELSFPNPFGIAAGFDKDARVPDAMLDLGFGFAEVGSVTSLAQAGNPPPRVFRLIGDRAIINRLGFNNGGHAAMLRRLQSRAKRGIVGINVGANKDSSDRTADYVTGVRLLYDVASYFTVNISSPNTPGLRDLQAPAALHELLGRVMAARNELAGAGKPVRPIVVKIAPDIAEADLPAVIACLIAHEVDGIAIANTTLARTGVNDLATAKEAGGLSGRPLFHRSTVMLARVYQLTKGLVPLIGIGGIDSGATALAKIEAGASLLQLYTGLIYEGPGLVARMKRHLVAHCDTHGLSGIAEVKGTRAEEWASRTLDA